MSDFLGMSADGFVDWADPESDSESPDVDLDTTPTAHSHFELFNLRKPILLDGACDLDAISSDAYQ